MLVKFESEVLTVNNQILSVVILNSRNDNCNIGDVYKRQVYIHFIDLGYGSHGRSDRRADKRSYTIRNIVDYTV